MKFIDSSFEILEQEPSLLGVYKQIEKAARTAYKSEDKISDGSAEKMVGNLCNLNHGAALEHGTIYLLVNNFEIAGKYLNNKYSFVNGGRNNFYITTNARVIFENGWQDDLKYICEPTNMHEKRITVKFICSIGVGREITRHRSMSFLQESTRFCNYSKSKFGSELTFIIPEWIYNCRDEQASYIDYPTSKSKSWLMNYSGENLVNQLTCEDRHVAAWVNNLERCEQDYLYLINDDEGYQLKQEEARGILPLDLKSELIVTGFVSDWIHFFKLRSYIAATGKPHPDIRKLVDNLMQEFIDRNYCIYEQIKENNK